MSKMKKYHITLTEEERKIRQHRKTYSPEHHTGKDSPAFLRRQGREIVKSLDICPATVFNIRKRFFESGLNYAIEGKDFPGQPPKLDGKGQATLIAAACSEPPDGHSSWTMQMLADKLVELEVTESISDETVRQYLKKVKSNRGRESSGVSAS